MKNIVVPTDFSKNAHKALEYAVELANQFDANIHLISSYVVRRRTGMLKSIADIQKQDTEEGLGKLAREFRSSLSEETTIMTMALQGDVVHTIVKYATRIDADLIIMGTRGIGSVPRLFWGSNTIAVMSKSEGIPLLAVPEEFEVAPVKRIVFATDMNKISSEAVIKPMVKIAEINKAEIEILHVAPSIQQNDDLANDFYFANVDHTYYRIDNTESSVNESINQFVNTTKSQLLCMIRKQRGLLSDLFHNSVTEKTAASLEAPLLIMFDSE